MIALLLLGYGNAEADWVKKLNAIQLCYQHGVPQTDRNGRPLGAFDPINSFFPIGLYHFVASDQESGIEGFEALARAGFNFCHYWPGQSLGSIADAAAKAGIQLIPEHPSIADVTAFKNHPAIFGWYLEEEPTGSYWGPNMQAKYDAYVGLRDSIKAVDPRHPVFVLDSPWITPPATAWWVKWNTSGDITSHDNYPINGKRKSLSFDQGIPESVSLAVASVHEKKPLLFCAQAIYVKSTTFPCELPTPSQERSMIYTAIIHGATGIIYFGMDSFVLRNGNCVGIAPDPKASYAARPNCPQISATDAQLKASRDLWDAVVELNRELKTLRPSILSPTAMVPYEVSIDDSLPSITPDPIRTLLKLNPAGGYTLLLSNIDDAPQRVRIVFPDKAKLSVNTLYGQNGAVTKSVNSFVFSCPPYDASAFSISMR